MKYCPLCTCGEFKGDEARVCDSCGFVDKPADQLTKREKLKLLSSYAYEELTDGSCRIVGVENARSLLLRESVAVPRAVSEIGDRAMSHLKFMTELELPSGLRAVGDGAFSDNRFLRTVFIPKTVVFMGDGVFKGCDDLETVYCEAEEQPRGWSYQWLDGCSVYPVWGAVGIDG